MKPRHGWIVVAALVSALAACSGEEPPPAAAEEPPGHALFFEESCCENDLECQDGNWCNGIETCDCWGECGVGEAPCQHLPDPTDPCLAYGDCIVDRIDAPGTGYGMGHCEIISVCTTCVVVGDCPAPPDACQTVACVAGYCEYTPVDCDDGDSCTNDSCNPATGCLNQIIPGCCNDDGDCIDSTWCDGDETCDLPSETCQPAASPRCTGVCENCNEATDTCDPIIGGSCTVAGDCCGSPGSCFDWGCVTGNCVAQPRVCNDSNPCTDDSCNVGLDSCMFIDNADPCASDTNPCTLDICSGGSCQHIATVGALCNDDGDNCNGVNTCNASGNCVMTTLPVTCTSTQCRTRTCNPATGMCTGGFSQPNGTACNDEGAVNNECNQGRCSGGVCTTEPRTGDVCTLAPPQACATGECNALGICQAMPVVAANDTCAGSTSIPSVGSNHWQATGDTTCSNNDYGGTCGGANGRDVVHDLDLTVGTSFQLRGYEVNMDGVGWDPVLHDRTTCTDAASQMHCNDDCFDTVWTTCDYGGQDSGFYIPPLPMGTNNISFIEDSSSSGEYGSYVIDVQAMNVENGWPCDQTPGDPDTFYGPDVTYGGTWRGHIVDECDPGPSTSGYFNAIVCDPPWISEPWSNCFGWMDWWYASRAPGPGCWQGNYLNNVCWFGDNCQGGWHYWWEYCDWPANAWFVVRTPTRTNYRFTLTENATIPNVFDGVISVWHLVDPNVCFYVEADSCYTGVGFNNYSTPWQCLDAGESYIIGVSKRVWGDPGTNYQLTVERGGGC